MKYVLMITGLCIMLAGALSAYVWLRPSPMEIPVMNSGNSMEPSTTKTDNEMMSDTEMMDKDAMEDDTSMMNNSRYIVYEPGLVQKTTSSRRILFFYANWCPTCRPADASFRENQEQIPEDMTVIRVNYNDPDTDQEEKDLATTYGVTYQHTFVQIDSQGNKIGTWNGGAIDELLTNSK